MTPEEIAAQAARTGPAAPRPGARPSPQESAEDALADAVTAGARGAAKSPLIALASALVAAVVGGGVGVNGWHASSAAAASYVELVKKVDKLTEELAATRKSVDEARTTSLEQAASNKAERHEERIRKLEDQAQASALDRSQMRLEIESLRKERDRK